MISNATTLSAFFCLDICLAHIAMSNQHHLCWEFSIELVRLLYAGANISLIYKEPYFFENEWDGRDAIGPRLLFSTKANTRNIFRKRILVCFLFLPSFFFFWITRHTIFFFLKDQTYYLYDNYIFVQKTETRIVLFW